MEESGAFKSEFRFVVAERHFNLPATSVSENDFPGEFRRMGRFRGEQVPGRFAFAASHDEPEGLVMRAIENGESDDPGFAFTTTASIPNQTVIPGTPGFAQFAWLFELFEFIQKLVVLWPAQNKASPSQESLCQPGIASKATIPKMDDFLAP